MLFMDGFGTFSIFKFYREGSGSVVDCLTQGRGVVGSSAQVSLRCVLEQDALILAYYLFNPGKSIQT